jgi:hypothetical protein
MEASATPRDARIVLRSRLYRLLAERKEYTVRDLEDRLAATAPRREPSLSPLDAGSIEDATEIDRLCGAAVRILSRGWSAGVVELLGCLDQERLAAVALALPERRPRAVVGRDLNWFRAFATVDEEAVREVETLIRDFDAITRKQDDTLRTLGVDPEQFTEDGRRALLGLPVEP